MTARRTDPEADSAAIEPTGGRGKRATNGAEATNLPPDVEAPEMTDDDTDAVMEQAKRDLDDGQVDTDLRSTPGLDAEQKKKLLKPSGR